MGHVTLVMAAYLFKVHFNFFLIERLDAIDDAINFL